MEDYLHLMLQEIELKAEIYAKNSIVTHIHFGGGSPTILRAVNFTDLMHKLRQKFLVSDKAEIAIEIDPRHMSEAKAASYARAGVTRASIGVQDFDQKVLKAINREQPFHATYETVALLRNYGIKGINFDLMYGLPYQSQSSIIKTAEYAALMNPDRIALFGYAHVPWMKRHMRMIPEDALPDSSARLDLFESAASVLRGKEYIQIGIDHFAKPEDSLSRAWIAKTLKRNFQGYTDDNNEFLLGFGISAISQTPSCYAQNFTDMPHYRDSIINGASSWSRMAVLTREDHVRREIIQSIMRYFHADVGKIADRYGFDRNYFKNEIESLKELRVSSLIDIEESVITVNVPQIARIVCAAFDAYLQPIGENQAPRHVTAT